MMSFHLKDGRYWFCSICLNQDGRHWTFKILVLLKVMLVNAKSGVKKSKNFHLSPGQVHQNFYLSFYQITCPCEGKINYQWIFYLSTGHWVKIYACPVWNSTCPGHQDKWFFYPCKCLKPFPQLTSDLKFFFILSRGQMLLILGHLLKPRWPPWNFLICML